MGCLTHTHLYFLHKPSSTKMAPSYFLIIRPPPIAALFPYTPLLRSATQVGGLSATQIGGLTANQLRGLTTTDFAGITPTQIPVPSPTQIHPLSSTNLSSPAPTTIAHHSTSQHSVILPTQTHGPSQTQ